MTPDPTLAAPVAPAHDPVIPDVTRTQVVMDTSALVADPEGVFDAYPDGDLIVPLTVIEELDGLKKRLDSVGAADALEVEMLMGLGTDLLDRLAAKGIATREYCIFGSEWWLYVLNRIAEDPTRVFQVIVDLGRAPISPPATAR